VCVFACCFFQKKEKKRMMATQARQKHMDRLTARVEEQDIPEDDKWAVSLLQTNGNAIIPIDREYVYGWKEVASVKCSPTPSYNSLPKRDELKACLAKIPSIIRSINKDCAIQTLTLDQVKERYVRPKRRGRRGGGMSTLNGRGEKGQPSSKKRRLVEPEEEMSDLDSLFDDVETINRSNPIEAPVQSNVPIPSSNNIMLRPKTPVDFGPLLKAVVMRWVEGTENDFPPGPFKDLVSTFSIDGLSYDEAIAKKEALFAEMSMTPIGRLLATYDDEAVNILTETIKK